MSRVLAETDLAYEKSRRGDEFLTWVVLFEPRTRAITTVATEVRSAGEDDWKLHFAVWMLSHGHQAPVEDQASFAYWQARARQSTLSNAKAWESSAMACLPPGWDISEIRCNPQGAERNRWVVFLSRDGGRTSAGMGATMGLAILRAVLHGLQKMEQQA